VRTLDLRRFAAYAVCSLAAVFYLPTLVSVSPATSASYIFSYNNSFGVVLVLLLAAIGSIWTRGLNLQLRTTGDSPPVSRKTLIVSLIAVICGCYVMYAIAGRFGGFGESTYFIDRAWLLSQGRIPYVDFEWVYGVSFLYGPILLQHLLPIDIAQAYYLFWGFNFLLGTLLLFIVVNMVDYPTRSKQSIFLLLYGSEFVCIVCMGVNYTYLRFTLPLFFILVVHRVLNGIGHNSRVYAALLAVAFTVVLLLTSPETAIAHAFACICVFLLSAPGRSGSSLATSGGLLLALAIVFGIALKLHVMDAVRVNGKGADSFPIAFSPHILIFFLALFICACYVVRRFSEPGIQDNTIGLVAYSIPMVAGALGRCDPGHVIANGEGVFIASMFYISNYRTGWKLYAAAFALFLIIASSHSGMQLYMPRIRKVAYISIGESNNNSTIGRPVTYIARKYIAKFGTASNRAKLQAVIDDPPLVEPDGIDLRSLYPSWHGGFLAPYGYRPNGIGTYLSSQVDYGHYEGFENANSLDAINHKLAEIKNHPEEALLLPGNFEDACHVSVAEERHLITVLFAFRYFGKAVHTESIRRPICDYIDAQYSLEKAPAPQNYEYGLWVAKPVRPSP
jgi:hypothetical protein